MVIRVRFVVLALLIRIGLKLEYHIFWVMFGLTRWNLPIPWLSRSYSCVRKQANASDAVLCETDHVRWEMKSTPYTQREIVSVIAANTRNARCLCCEKSAKEAFFSRVLWADIKQRKNDVDKQIRATWNSTDSRPMKMKRYQTDKRTKLVYICLCV